jgi:hypothetical protein
MRDRVKAVSRHGWDGGGECRRLILGRKIKAHHNPVSFLGGPLSIDCVIDPH